MSMGPIEIEQRHQAIAQIRAYADWLQANPDVPVPTYLSGTVHPHHLSREASMVMARNLADRHHGAKLSSGESLWVAAQAPVDGPLRVSHTVFVNERKRGAGDSW